MDKRARQYIGENQIETLRAIIGMGHAGTTKGVDLRRETVQLLHWRG